MPAHTVRRLFSRETAVSIDIRASAERVWDLLVDAPGYARWNSTVVSLTGEVQPGGRLSLVAALDPTRTFHLRVRTVEPGRRLVWGDAMGERTFTLSPQGTDGVRFEMRERIGGPLFPLFARMIPDFNTAFDQFAADIKRTAEATGDSRES